jgi:hypothetical protein
MRGSPRNIAILLALLALAVTGVAGSAEAKGGGSMGAAAAKVSRGTQIRLNRMKTKMALRTRGMLQQKTRRQLRLGKRKMMRAMSRREVGLRTSETERTRLRFARNVGDSASSRKTEDVNEDAVGGYGRKGDKDRQEHDAFADPEVTREHREESSSAKQRKKMRDKVRKSTTPPKKKIQTRRRD